MATVNPFRFSTKFQDEETDLLYYGYRYYSGSTGRWLSQDPVGEGGGINLYAFAANDAIGYVDPTGLCAGCTCKRVHVSFKPGGTKMQIGFLDIQETVPGGGPGGGPGVIHHYRFGDVIKVEWEVEGPEEECRFYFKEPKGGVKGTKLGVEVRESWGTDDPAILAQYPDGWVPKGRVMYDPFGIDFEPFEKGKYTISVDLHQLYKCVGSDGIEKVEHGDYKKNDSGKYPPKTPVTVITGGF